jgi:hypothetical protein
MEVDLDDLDEYETEDERKYTLVLEFYWLQHKWSGALRVGKKGMLARLLT